MFVSASTYLLVAMGQSAAGTAGRVEEHRRLEACIAKIKDDPAEAYEDGLAWVGEGGRPFARQCTALALVELGHEAEGAVRLEELANASNGGSLRQRVIYLTQSGNAWLLAGAPDAALVTLTNAIKLGPNDPNLRADRGAAYMELERWEEAADDLDFALGALRQDQNIWNMRAETRLQLGDIDGAEFDVGKAMELDPTHIPTLLLRGRVRQARQAEADEEQTENSAPVILVD